MTNARKARIRRRAAGMTPQRAWAGPYVAPEGEHGAGLTNAEALDVIVELLGGPPIVGGLYRVGMVQGQEGRKVQFIGEYLGLAEDRGVDEAGRTAVVEPALLFAVRNPVPPAEASYGTAANPLLLWPLDIWYLRQAEPGDLETPLHHRVTGEEIGPPPGRARVH